MYKFIKRLFDIILSLVVLTILLPVLIPLVILLKLTGEGEIFYFQRRIGYKNEYFDIWKFATMLKNSPNMGTGMITLRNDSRVTPMGGFLRMTKLNELPQIINVLKGDMSIVGPRPLVDKTFNAYPEDIRYKVYDSKPGITGIGSIVFRDEEKLLSTCTIPPQEYYDTVIAPYKGELEIWYNARRSLLVDFQIIFLTAWVIVFPSSRLMDTFFKDLPRRKF
ncbi:sugar transferase [Chitinophaga arvensicola]|uniref:Sugar transferase involved in LPS biosynthesis (Colanic, teichoic acid) n=1 Tax=Chitinophaga arvensicola TaxID=29529 RepID=A0A1I0NNY9_9BACT|nr:sugar transferase [Chitinophaga arvensicola]SEW03089.1 Sugar transferase involved in LPS biosynthesis (colanic, teichoic acid) [Chitinophaga arvensicola]